MATNHAIAPGSAADFLDAVAAGLPRQGFFAAPVIVAVSGGADSVALLCGLHALAGRQPSPPRIIVAHAQHDLREEAAADAAFVAALAHRLAVPCSIRELPVRGRDGIRGEGVEARARRLRLDFFAATAGEHGARHVAVGHTADDQAETILHRILRGTGPAGLRGMAPSRALCEGVALVRPLLAVRRRVVREHLVSLGQPWCEDATNADIRYARNFLRHDILPQCEAASYPAATQSLVRLGALAAGLAGAVRSAAEHLLEQCGCQRAAGAVVIRRAGLAGLDPYLVAEFFVALWDREGWPRRDMTATHFARLARMAAFPGPAVDLPGGVRCHVAADGTLRLVRTADDVRPGPTERSSDPC